MTRKDFLAALGAGAVTPQMLKSSPESKPASGGSPPVLKLSELCSLDDVEAQARSVMLSSVYDYVSAGAADELTTRWNREKYRELRLQAEVLTNVSQLDCTTTLLGQRMKMPILLAPTSNHRLVHPEGELATARGAGLAEATMVLSNGANTSVEDVLRVATQPVWFQLYVDPDRGLARELVQRVEAAGAKALCVTVDAPIDGARNRPDRNPVVIPPGVGYPNYLSKADLVALQSLEGVHPPLLEWRDIEWIRSLTKLPVLLKGIMNPRDADTAVKLGIDGIMVSNHGGRCLDTQPATIEVLPRVVAQVNGRVPVIVDGGIRRGTDVVKAIALGASAVQIGRPCIYGLAVGGAEGVAYVLQLLRQELLMAMALLGRSTLAQIDRSVIWH